MLLGLAKNEEQKLLNFGLVKLMAKKVILALAGRQKIKIGTFQKNVLKKKV